MGTVEDIEALLHPANDSTTVSSGTDVLSLSPHLFLEADLAGFNAGPHAF